MRSQFVRYGRVNTEHTPSPFTETFSNIWLACTRD